MAHIVDSDSLKPTAAAIDKAIKDEVEKFEPSVLKHVEVPEKVVLPSKEGELALICPPCWLVVD